MGPSDEERLAGGQSHDAEAAHNASKPADGQAAPGARDGLPEGLVSDKYAGRLDSTGSRTVRLGDAAQALAGNKKALWGIAAGAGITGIIVAAMVLIAHFQIANIMETLERHLMNRTKYTFDQRKDVLVREYFNKWYGSKGDSGINDSSAPVSKQILRKMHTGKFEKAINAKYEVSTRSHPDFPGESITTLKDRSTGRVTTIDSSGSARKQGRADAIKFADSISQGQSWGWARRKLIKPWVTRRFAVEWHSLDPLKGGLQEVRKQAFNQASEQFVKNPKIAEAVDSMLNRILGSGDGDSTETSKAAKAGYGEATTGAAASDISAETIASKMASSVAKVSGPIIVITLIDAWCHMIDFIDNDTLHKFAQMAREQQMGGLGASWLSKASQEKASINDPSATNIKTIEANNELLVSKPDKQGRVYSVAESNNYARSQGENVAYQPTKDCKNTKELCDSKLPPNAMDSSVIQDIIKTAQDTPFSGADVIFKTLGIGEGGHVVSSAACEVLTSAIDPLLNLPGEAIDFILTLPGAENNPLGAAYQADKAIAKEGMDWFIKDVVTPVVAPTDDEPLRGANLFNPTYGGVDILANSTNGSTAGTMGEKPCSDPSNSAEQKRAYGNLCGHKLTKDEVIAVNDAANQDQKELDKAAPLTTKIASLGNPNSLFSRMISATPATPQLAAQTVNDGFMAAISPRRWQQLGSSLSGLFAKPAYATDELGRGGYVIFDDGSSPFTEQWGYTQAELESSWGSPTTETVDTMVGCTYLLSITAGDQNDLPADCPKDESGVGVTTPAAGDTSALSNDVKALATQILDNKNIDPAGRLVKQDLDDAKAGKDSSAGVPLNPKILQAILVMAKDHKIQISAMESGGTGHSDGSYHYSGAAVDISAVDGVATNGRDAGAQAILKAVLPTLPNGSGIGQSLCGSLQPALPAGVTEFSDTCNHLHLQVPR